MYNGRPQQAIIIRPTVSLNVAAPVGRDRGHAGRDRGSAGRDRGPVGRDRGPAGRDRGSAGRDRSPVGRDRGPAERDRGRAGSDRSPVGRDRGPVYRRRKAHRRQNIEHDAVGRWAELVSRRGSRDRRYTNPIGARHDEYCHFTAAPRHAATDAILFSQPIRRYPGREGLLLDAISTVYHQKPNLSL